MSSPLEDFKPSRAFKPDNTAAGLAKDKLTCATTGGAAVLHAIGFSDGRSLFPAVDSFERINPNNARETYRRGCETRARETRGRADGSFPELEGHASGVRVWSEKSNARRESVLRNTFWRMRCVGISIKRPNVVFSSASKPKRPECATWTTSHRTSVSSTGVGKRIAR